MDTIFRPKTTRRVPRVAADFPVILNLEKNRFYCQAHQLSEFGILVTPTQKKLIGQIVKIDLLPEHPNHRLSLSGVVAYAIDSGLGIRFTDMGPEQQFTLKRYV